MFIKNAYKDLFLLKVVVMAENKRLVEFIHLNKLKSMYLNFISSHTEFGQSWINIFLMLIKANVKSPISIRQRTVQDETNYCLYKYRTKCDGQSQVEGLTIFLQIQYAYLIY